MKISKIALPLVAIGLLLQVGCAGSKSLAVRPIESKLSAFTTIYFSTESSIVEDVSQQMDDLEVEFLERLNKEGYFPSALLGTCTENCEKALIIKAVVSSVKKVSGTSRFFLGAFAGKASLTTEVTFIDGGTGATIGSYEVTGKSGGTGYSGGTGDAVKKTAKAIVKLIRENF